MASLATVKAAARESARSLTDAIVLLFKGKVALNNRRVNRLTEVFKSTLVERALLSANQKFIQLESDVAQMAARLGRAPPEILVTTHPIGIMALSEKCLFVSQAELETCTSEQLKAVVGHELAHIARGDHLHLARPPNHTQELAADRLGVELSGEPDAMVSWLERIAKEDPIAAQGNQVYPPISKRIEEILKSRRSNSTPRFRE